MNFKQDIEFQIEKHKNLLADATNYLQHKNLIKLESEMSINVCEGKQVNVLNGKTDSVEFNKDRNFCISVYNQQKKGLAFTSDFNWSAICQTIDKALKIAQYTQQDKYASLPKKDDLAFNYPDLKLYSPWDITTTQMLDMAKDCEEYGLNYSNKITNSDGCSISSYDGYKILTNSHGFMGDYKFSKHNIACTLIATENKEMQRDYSHSITRDATKLLAIKDIALLAAQRTLKRLSPCKIKTQKSPVIFLPDVASELIGNFIAAISGANLYRKTTFLEKKLKQQIFTEIVDIFEDPHVAAGLGSAAFDNEGVQTKARSIVTNGILQDYILSSYYARKLGLQTTGNAGGIHNIFVQPQQKSLAELIKEMGRGLVINEMMGQGVNLTTGDYSRAISGFWVENGEIQHAVEGVTVGGNLQNMFANISAIAQDININSSIQTGSFLIDEMTLASS